MFFDTNKIHIQAFLLFINRKLIIFRSSSPEKYFLYKSESQKIRNLSLKSESQIWVSNLSLRLLGLWKFEILKSWNFVYFLRIYCLNYFLRRWGIENYTFFIIKQHPNLNLNFVCVKKHEQGFALNFVFSWNVP